MTGEASAAELRRRLREAEETLRAIREGAVDALLVEGPNGNQVYTLEGADRPYRLFVEQMQQGAATLNAEGEIISCNLSLAQLLNVPHERLIGQPLRGFIAPPSLDRYGDLLREDPIHASQGEIQMRRSDGVGVPTYFYLATLASGSGSMIGVLITDLTAQKYQTQLTAAYEAMQRSEAALRESETRLETELADTRLLQEISSALIFDENIQSLYEKIVQAAVRIMSADSASLQSYQPEPGPVGGLQLLAVHGLDTHCRKLWESLRGDSEGTCGMVLRSAKRVIVPVLEQCAELSGTPELELYTKAGIRAAQTTPLLARSGRIVGMISTYWKSPHAPTERQLRILDLLARQAADFIERIRTERALRRVVEFDEAVMTNMGEGLYTVDAEGRVTSLNPAAERMFGWTFEELRGKKIHPVTHYKHRDGSRFPAEECPEFRVLSSGHPIVHQEDSFIRRDGSFFDVDCSSAPMRGPDGNQSLVVVFRDITERKRADEELRRANGDLEQFAYSASHDLQEPIRNLSIYSELLGAQYADSLDVQGKQYLNFITAGARRMEALIKDLLAYTQSTSADLEDAGEVSARGALERALGDLSEAIRETGAKIHYESLPSLPMREVQLQQLFQNLVGNAIKYRRESEPPCIRISAERAGGYWKFSVRDNGIGISPAFAKTVFGLFKRLHSESHYSGTGIGLAICKRIVERRGGRIWVVSDGAGNGSTFFFTLPASDGQEIAEA